MKAIRRFLGGRAPSPYGKTVTVYTLPNGKILRSVNKRTLSGALERSDAFLRRESANIRKEVDNEISR